MTSKNHGREPKNIKIKTQILKDTAKHQGLRNQLVSILEQKDITDKKVLEAIGKVPRHLFLNSSFEPITQLNFPLNSNYTNNTISFIVLSDPRQSRFSGVHSVHQSN